MPEPTFDAPPRVRGDRLDLILSFLAGACALVALVSFVAVAVHTGTGSSPGEWQSPLWGTIFTCAYWGIPVALLLLGIIVVRRLLISRAAPRRHSESSTDR